MNSLTKKTRLWLARTFLLGVAVLPLVVAVQQGGAAAPPAAARLDRFGDRLAKNAIARLGTVRLRQADTTLSVAWAPDGKTIVSGSHHGTVRIWKAATGELLNVPIVQDDGHVVCFPQDGSLLVTAGYQGVTRLINQKTGKVCLERFGSLQKWVALSPNGKVLAIGGGQSRLIIYDIDKGETRFSIQMTAHTVPGPVAFSPDGKFLAAAPRSSAGESTIRLWDVCTGKEVGQLKGHRRRVFCLAFHPRNGTLVSGGMDDTIRFWDVRQQRQLREIGCWAFRLAFSPDAELLASCDNRSSTVHFWDPDTGKKVRSIPNCGGRVVALAFSPTGETIVTAGDSHALR